MSLKKFFENNRKKLSEILEDNSIAIFFAGNAPVKRGDEKYPFSPDRNVFYLTGCDKEGFIFTIAKIKGEIKENLFIVPFDEEKAKWVGAVLSPEEYKELTGIEEVKYLYDFYETISNNIFSDRVDKVYLDLENRYFNYTSSAIEFANELQKKYPYVQIHNVYPIMAQMRTIKSDFEIENIKKAINITKDGIYEMMKNAKPNMYEYEIEAYFDFILKKNGIKHKAFQSIAASGKNATILHYADNNTKTAENDLILFDVGASVNYYSGDITRTFPVSGKFTKRQREIYNIVLNGQALIIDIIKPNIPFKSLNETLKEFYFNELKKIGLVKTKEDVSKYYYHNVSHLLGLETHDVGRHNEGNLKVGMVLTVEPGLYIYDEGIGIRIEDNVLVTEKGCEVLSKDIIKTVDEIEKFMSEGKL